MGRTNNAWKLLSSRRRGPDRRAERVEALVVGSGAGGAVTALELGRAGLRTVVLEEGLRAPPDALGAVSSVALARLYRRRGMTPLLGAHPIAYVEGCTVGGSTEVNSGFWHRTPEDVLERWQNSYGLRDLTGEALEPHFRHAERALGVGLHARELPETSRRLALGASRLGLEWDQVPRAVIGCEERNACPGGCPSGAKPGMSRSILPEAERLGVEIRPGHRVERILLEGDRAIGVTGVCQGASGDLTRFTLYSDRIFVCGGPLETPALLRRSGITHRVGDTLSTHPMLKVLARFDSPVNARSHVMPLVQIRLPDQGAQALGAVTLGGSFFSLGHAALSLGSRLRDAPELLAEPERLALYYVAVRGAGRGSVRPSRLDPRLASARYGLAASDLRGLSRGFAALSQVLLEAGAEWVIPSAAQLPLVRCLHDARRWERETLPAGDLELTTVHAFSSCPIGSHVERCAADPVGRVWGVHGLSINDASMLPDSPGVNPQGSVMALARRNVLEILATRGRGHHREP